MIAVLRMPASSGASKHRIVLLEEKQEDSVFIAESSGDH
jgi:hypothetical protein